MTEKVLHQYLGAPRFTRELPEKEPRVGIVNGLAYTTSAAKRWKSNA